MKPTTFCEILALEILLVCLALQAAYAVDTSHLANQVHVKLGQKLVIEFEVAGDTLTNPSIVSVDRDKDNITIELHEIDKTCYLDIINSFRRFLRFRCLARLNGHNDYFEIKTDGAHPGMVNTQDLDARIDEVILFDFRFTNEKLPPP
jgi:hypothetical protein